MPNVEQVLTKAFRRWYTTAMHYTIGIVKANWLVGPRPSRLGVKTSNLRNRVAGKVLADGFMVGTNVKYGIYWEKGIKAHRVTAKPGKMLAIPVKLAKGVTAKKAKKGGILKTGKMKGLIFRKSVWIPKQEPRKWLEPGIKQALPEVERMGHQELQSSIMESFPNRVVG